MYYIPSEHDEWTPAWVHDLDMNLITMNFYVRLIKESKIV